jgi:hypothetical protein
MDPVPTGDDGAAVVSPDQVLRNAVKPVLFCVDIRIFTEIKYQLWFPDLDSARFGVRAAFLALLADLTLERFVQYRTIDVLQQRYIDLSSDNLELVGDGWLNVEVKVLGGYGGKL